MRRNQFRPLVLLVLASFAVGADAEPAELGRGATRLTGRTPDGHAIIASVRTTGYTPTWPHSSGFRWGAERTTTIRSMVTSIGVQVGHDEVFLPLSAYADLANPREAFLETAENEYRLIIVGGEASTSYRAALVFEGRYIKRRKVSHGAFPESAWEETVYSFTTRNE
jgi:hypothetical protein